MRVLGSMAAGLLLVALMTAGCGDKQAANNAGKGNSNAAALNSRANTQPDNVRRVTVTELRDMLEQGKAIVIDVRGDAAYEAEHIKGSLDIPETQLLARSGEFPKDKLIVFYCS